MSLKATRRVPLSRKIKLHAEQKLPEPPEAEIVQLPPLFNASAQGNTRIKTLEAEADALSLAELSSALPSCSPVYSRFSSVPRECLSRTSSIEPSYDWDDVSDTWDDYWDQDDSEGSDLSQSAASFMSWTDEVEVETTKKVQEMYDEVERFLYDEGPPHNLRPDLIEECLHWKSKFKYLRVVGVGIKPSLLTSFDLSDDEEVAYDTDTDSDETIIADNEPRESTSYVALNEETNRFEYDDIEMGSKRVTNQRTLQENVKKFVYNGLFDYIYPKVKEITEATQTPQRHRSTSQQRIRRRTGLGLNRPADDNIEEELNMSPTSIELSERPQRKAGSISHRKTGSITSMQAPSQDQIENSAAEEPNPETPARVRRASNRKMGSLSMMRPPSREMIANAIAEDSESTETQALHSTMNGETSVKFRRASGRLMGSLSMMRPPSREMIANAITEDSESTETKALHSTMNGETSLRVRRASGRMMGSISMMRPPSREMIANAIAEDSESTETQALHSTMNGETSGIFRRASGRLMGSLSMMRPPSREMIANAIAEDSESTETQALHSTMNGETSGRLRRASSRKMGSNSTMYPPPQELIANAIAQDSLELASTESREQHSAANRETSGKSSGRRLSSFSSGYEGPSRQDEILRNLREEREKMAVQTSAKVKPVNGMKPRGNVVPVTLPPLPRVKSQSKELGRGKSQSKELGQSNKSQSEELGRGKSQSKELGQSKSQSKELGQSNKSQSEELGRAASKTMEVQGTKCPRSDLAKLKVTEKTSKKMQGKSSNSGGSKKGQKNHSNK